MSLRCVHALAVALLMAGYPAAGTAQDLSVLDGLRKALDGTAAGLRITAAGSAYLPGPDRLSRRHVRVESYLHESDPKSTTASERVVRLDKAEGAGQAPVNDTRTAGPDSPWSDQYFFWVTPHGFLAGATSRPVTISSETVLGAEYRTVTFAVGEGRQVRGYFTEAGVLERTRTAFEDPSLGNVQFEAVYLQWTDFGGVTFPSLIIQRENDQLSRVLVVRSVESPRSQ